jgi:hypothetical protein
MREVAISKTGCPEVAPIVFHLPGGFLSVMPRCRIMNNAEFAIFDKDKFCVKEDYIVPVENKNTSFGWLNGSIVAVDYGN